MDRPALKTLILPFDRQDRSDPTAEKPWAFFNAHTLPQPNRWTSGLICQQSFRPAYLALTQTGFDTEPVLDRDGFAGALVLSDKSKAVNERNVIQAIKAVEPNAPILIAGEKTTGIAPLKKWAANFGEIVDAFSKFHAQCFTLIASPEAKLAAEKAPIDPQAGLFAKGKIDKGSALLAATFDATLTGDVADFCSGTGYLSKALCEKTTPNSIALLEAEHHALQAARVTMADIAPAATFHWIDLTSEQLPARYDTIIMNPPFHTFRAAEPSLGQTLIKAARKSLRPGGILRLVANRNLPYEATLQSAFGNFREIVVEDGFKVLQSRAKS